MLEEEIRPSEKYIPLLRNVVEAISTFPAVAKSPTELFALWESMSDPGTLENELLEAEDCHSACYYAVLLLVDLT